MSEEYPNNSQKARTNKKPDDVPPDVEMQIEKIIQGEALVRKPSGFKRFRRSFIAGDAASVKEHIVWNLAIPAAQDALSEALSTFVDMMIFGEKRGRMTARGVPTSGAGSTSKVGYNSISSNARSAIGSSPVQFEPPARFAPNEIYLSNRAEAEAILIKMFEVLEKYKAVTVANLNGMIGQSSDIIDYKYGWTNLDSADFQRTKHGVHLVLPPPQDLN